MSSPRGSQGERILQSTAGATQPDGLEETTDTFYHSNLSITQPRQGYRFSADAVALAEFIRIRHTESLLDLCSGVGIIPLLVWTRSPYRLAVGVELQKSLADLAYCNITQNNLQQSLHILRADVRGLTVHDFRGIPSFQCDGTFDVVSANPPYWPVRKGRLNPNPQKAAARHETHLTLLELLKTCKRFLKPRGCFYLSHRLEREEEVLRGFHEQGFRLFQTKRPSGQRELILFEAWLEADKD